VAAVEAQDAAVAVAAVEAQEAAVAVAPALDLRRVYNLKMMMPLPQAHSPQRFALALPPNQIVYPALG